MSSIGVRQFDCLPPRCLEVLSGVAAPLRDAVEADPAKGIAADDLPELDLRSESSLCIITSLVPVCAT